MLNLSTKTVELAVMLLHIGGLSGSASMISVGRLYEAFLCAVVASACILILTGATTLAEFIKMKLSAMSAKHHAAESDKQDEVPPV
ncbi:MAG: hypothetical protein DMF72_15225 [Acidobacteria bacterium]|nr:MAG: hypothetical protein DMF72_15225 [Acidobacteriota bacterium]